MYSDLCCSRDPSLIPICLVTKDHEMILLYKNEAWNIKINEFSQLKDIYKELQKKDQKKSIQEILAKYNINRKQEDQITILPSNNSQIKIQEEQITIFRPLEPSWLSTQFEKEVLNSILTQQNLLKIKKLKTFKILIILIKISIIIIATVGIEINRLAIKNNHNTEKNIN